MLLRYFHTDFFKIFTVKYLSILISVYFFIPGFSEYSDRASGEIIYNVISLMYNPKNKHSSVVLTNEDDVIGYTFPPPLDVHAKFLEDILLFRPRALVIDVIFADQRRDSASYFLDVVSSFAENNINVYLAIPPVESGLQLRQDLRELLDKDLVIPVSPALGDFGNGGFAYAPFDSQGNETIAWSIARNDFGIGNSKTTFHLWWSGSLKDLNAIGEQENYINNYSISKRIFSILSIEAVSLVWEDVKDYARLKVGPFDQISSKEISLYADKTRIRNVIDGNIVFYGMDFSFAEDKIENPVYSDRIGRPIINGAMYHAMALQNITDRHNTFLSNSNKNTIYIVFIFIFAYVGSAIFSIVSNGTDFAGRPFKAAFFKLGVLTLQLTMLGVVCLVALYVFGVAPENWIGFGMASWIASITTRPEGEE